MVKKYKRDGQKFSTLQYGDELADIFIYLSLNARHLEIDLEESIIRKIRIIEDRLKSRQ